jgi:hypothetical protein
MPDPTISAAPAVGGHFFRVAPEGVSRCWQRPSPVTGAGNCVDLGARSGTKACQPWARRRCRQETSSAVVQIEPAAASRLPPPGAPLGFDLFGDRVRRGVDAVEEAVFGPERDSASGDRRPNRRSAARRVDRPERPKYPPICAASCHWRLSCRCMQIWPVCARRLSWLPGTSPAWSFGCVRWFLVRWAGGCCDADPARRGPAYGLGKGGPGGPRW